MVKSCRVHHSIFCKTSLGFPLLFLTQCEMPWQFSWGKYSLAQYTSLSRNYFLFHCLHFNLFSSHYAFPNFLSSLCWWNISCPSLLKYFRTQTVLLGNFFSKQTGWPIVTRLCCEFMVICRAACPVFYF